MPANIPNAADYAYAVVRELFDAGLSTAEIHANTDRQNVAADRRFTRQQIARYGRVVASPAAVAVALRQLANVL